jgi:hypothetical protein
LQGMAQVEDITGVADTLQSLEREGLFDSADSLEGWRLSYGGGINFNQASFSSNWTGGGVNSIAFGLYSNFHADYYKDRWSWNNVVDLLYGITRNEEDGARKNQDRIFFDTKVGYNVSNHWDAYFSLNFLSQFDKGFEYNDDGTRTLISQFMAPGYLTGSLGFEYKPVEYFWLRLSPFSPRITFQTETEQIFDNTDGKNYGVEEGETVRYEWFALQVLASYDKDLAENINLKARYQLFANYESFNFEEIDHRLDVIFTAKVTSYISVNLSGTLLYDFDQDDEIQLSQGIGIGLVYRVKNYEDE